MTQARKTRILGVIATLAHLERTPEVAVMTPHPPRALLMMAKWPPPPPGAAHGPTVPPLYLRATAGICVSVTNAFEAGWTSVADTASGSARAFAIYARRAAGSSARSAFRALLTIQAFGQAVYRLGTAARRGREHQRGNAAAIERMQERAVAGRSLRVYSRMGCRQC